MKYKIYSNPRVEANDFRMKYKCNFCDKFNSKVLEPPDCYSFNSMYNPVLICKTCLGNMMNALDKALIEEIKKGELK